MRLAPNSRNNPTFMTALRIHRTMSLMDVEARNHIVDQIRAVELDHNIQLAVDRQLDAELQASIQEDYKDGTFGSTLYGKLPLEIRSEIYSYVVTVDQSVHVFPPKGNEKHGFRLSLCEESSYDLEYGSCRCDDTRTIAAVQPTFFHNAIFLVSRTVRREALDAFFMTNKFTFTCLYELLKFTTMFAASCSKIQRLRIFERVDDYPASDFRVEGLQNARLALKALKHLDLHIYLGNWSAYEETYEDGLIHELLHFALGPPSRKKKRSFAELAMPPLGQSYPQANEAKKLKSAVECGSGNTLVPRMTEGDTRESPSIVRPEAEFLAQDLPSTAQLKSFLDGDFRGAKWPGKQPSLKELVREHNYKSQASHDQPTYSTFPIPPLRSFNAHVRMRTTSFMAAFGRTTDPKQAYYDALYERLIRHLTDVFMDAGRKYRTIEDVPRLMEKPKTRMREEDAPLTDKRGILFMRD